MAETRIRVALPTSILSVEHGLFLKSLRTHQVARWTSIFGVKEVVFYRDFSTSVDNFKKHRKIIEEHWRYFFTPPYLRKILVPLSPVLRYVGMLPPIRLCSFDVSRKPRRGEERLAYVFRDGFGRLRAHVGVKEAYHVVGDCRRVNDVVLVKVLDESEGVVECLEKDVYCGPTLSFSSSLKEVLSNYRGRVDSVIVTDRKGSVPTSETISSLRGRDVLVLFGSPKYDLFELSEGEGFKIEEYADYVWNTVPGQKVVTVRTEEALIITLGLLNACLKT